MSPLQDDPGGKSGVLERLRERGLSPRKALGQHFLHDPRLLQAMVRDAAVGPADAVFEIGTGPGTLTRELAASARHVLSLDVDEALLAFARDELGQVTNVELLLGDALEAEPPTRFSSQVAARLRQWPAFVWVSNLPYGIASRLIVAFLETEALAWTGASLLVQEEVAERLAPCPGSADVGPLGLLVAYWATSRLGRRVAPGAFWPPPEVWSRVVHLQRQEPLGSRAQYVAYSRWVKQLFQGRRKQLGGILRRTLGAERGKKALAALEMPPTARPQEVTPAGFLRIAQEFPTF